MADLYLQLGQYLALTALYFLPTLVAAARGVGTLDIAVANYLYGWTIAGWILALVAAINRDRAA